MTPRFSDHLLIVGTVLFTVYSQLIMRWQVGLAGSLPAGIDEKIVFVGRLLINPWVFSGIVATFLAGIFWMLTMTRFEISYAFPFVSLNYVIVLLAGFLLFGETFSTAKLIGTALIVAGLVIIAKG